MIPCVVLLGAVSLFPGCGLIAIPSTTAVPSPGLRTIALFDSESREPVTGATVRYQSWRIANWAVLPEELHIEFSDTAVPSGLLYENRGEPAISLVAAQTAPGRYQFESVRGWEWAHVWFPIGFSLGGVMRHYHSGFVTVECPGYKYFFISGDPARVIDYRALLGDPNHPENPDSRLYEITETGLSIFLLREDHIPETAPRRKYSWEK